MEDRQCETRHGVKRASEVRMDAGAFRHRRKYVAGKRVNDGGKRG